MNRKAILRKKIILLIKETDIAIQTEDDDTVEYLKKYNDLLKEYLYKIDNNTFPTSNGNLLGVFKVISEFDNLSNQEDLYNMAYDVDLYYCKKCTKW